MSPSPPSAATPTTEAAMNIYQAQRYAKNNGQFQGGKFVALFPAGAKNCEWLDAYMGLVRIEGIDGFLMVDDIDDQFPSLLVQPIEGEE